MIINSGQKDIEVFCVALVINFLDYCKLMMKSLPISWHGVTILAKICWKTYPLEVVCN